MDGVAGLKAGALRTGANALRFKVNLLQDLCLLDINTSYIQGDVFYNGASILDNTANGFSPSQNQALQLRFVNIWIFKEFFITIYVFRPSQQTSSAQLNFLNAFGNNLQQNSYNSPPSYNAPGNNNNFNPINNNNNEDTDVITINNQGPFNTGRDPDVIVGDPRAVDPGGISC